jgi:CRP-like cAMP-binding protein
MPRTRTQSLAGISRGKLQQLTSVLGGTQLPTVRRLAAVATIINVRRGAFIYKTGDRSDGLYVVISGRVKLSLPLVNGEEHVLSLIEPGQWFGESALTLGKVHANAASAAERTTVAYIPAITFLECLHRDRSFAAKVLTDASNRLHAGLLNTPPR